MKNAISVLMVPLNAIFFTLLFYHQSIGINFLIFVTVSLGILFWGVKKKPDGRVSWWVFAGTLLSALAVVVHNSSWSIFIAICSFFLLTGTFAYPKVQLLLTAAGISVTNTIQSFKPFMNSIHSVSSSNKGFRNVYKLIRMGLIPLLIFFIFILIYRTSNPLFDKGITKVTTWIHENFSTFFSHFNGQLIFLVVFGCVISIWMFYAISNNFFTDVDKNGTDELTRTATNKGQRFIKTLALKNEFKSAVVLLLALNGLLLIVNCIDIYWVWFHFEWNGDYLKQFVHEGTYLLILSILLSIAIVLFYFRQNLNFYKKNKLLKKMALLWLAQNAVLAVSVGIRNIWYIHYFALAYKRIGVLFFLIATLYGIFTIYQKVQQKRSTFYLLRTNTLAIYLLLIVSTFFNWDVLIARYNFNHYQKSFVHFDFLSTLSDNALPYLDKSMDELIEIKMVQEQLFPFEENYMTIDLYHKKTESRKEKFMIRFSEKKWLSWNLAEANAYKKLNFERK